MPTRRLLAPVARPFDALAAWWHDHGTQRGLGSLLVAAFLGALVVIEANRQGLLPGAVGARLTTSHFGAVTLTLTLLLLLSVSNLIFLLPRSVADSMGRQFEVLSLVFVRNAFKEFPHFGEPIEWRLVAPWVPQILGDMVGALLTFVLLGVYYRLQRHRPITSDLQDLAGFVAAKKAVALVLLAIFVGLGARSLWGELTGSGGGRFFETFFTVLIFSDVLLVLLSLRYSSEYAVVFRNSGFAVATVMIRLALTAPPYSHLLLGLGAALFAVGVSAAYNGFGAGRLAPERG